MKGVLRMWLSLRKRRISGELSNKLIYFVSFFWALFPSYPFHFSLRLRFLLLRQNRPRLSLRPFADFYSLCLYVYTAFVPNNFPWYSVINFILFFQSFELLPELSVPTPTRGTYFLRPVYFPLCLFKTC